MKKERDRLAGKVSIEQVRQTRKERKVVQKVRLGFETVASMGGGLSQK